MIVKECRSEEGGYPVAEVNDNAPFNEIEGYNTIFSASLYRGSPCNSRKSHTLFRKSSTIDAVCELSDSTGNVFLNSHRALQKSRVLCAVDSCCTYSFLRLVSRIYG